MKALIVCHKSSLDAGAFKTMLQGRGFEIDICLGFNDQVGEIDPLKHDLAIFTGGPMGVYQADIFPYLKNELMYLEKRLGGEKPYLGICLGGQLMAKALGAKVYPGAAGKEIGWHEIAVNDEGLKTPLHHLDVSKTPMFQWHGDTFDLPKDATLLASSAQYKNQVIGFGKKALGLQCHPEVTLGNIELWLATGYRDLPDAGLDVPTLRKQTHENIKILEKQRVLFFNEWLDNVL